MPDQKDIRHQLQRARAEREGARLALLRAREQLARIEQELAQLPRSFDPSDPASASRREKLAQAREKAAAAFKNLQGAYQQALDAEAKLYRDFSASFDPRTGLAQFSDDVPWLLLPVRIETRFKAQDLAGAPLTPPELWVRIFPDDCAIDTFEPMLSESEIKSAQLYWTQRWQAGGVETQQRAAWRGLVSSNGSGRAGWIVENYQPLNPAEEPRKPSDSDVILVVPTEMPVGDREAEAITNFWKAMWLADGDAEQEHAARQSLEASLGADRAGEVFERYKPANLAEQPRAPLSKRDVRLAVTFVVFPSSEDLPIKRRSWSQAARTYVLPDRFVVLGYVAGSKVLEQVGNPIPYPLEVGLDPSLPPEQQMHQAGGDLRMPDAMRWMSDFDRAIEVGMGFRIRLDDRTAGGFDRLIVLGLRLSEDQLGGKALVETLIEHHRVGRTGFSLVPQGTPTNNTEGSGAGFTQVDDADSSFDDHFLSAGLFEETSDWSLKKDGQWLAELLGIDANIMKKVRHSDATDQSEARAMNVALSPATLGYFLESMMSPVFSEQAAANILRFFNSFVSGRGMIPAVRIGNQPYGILPTTVFSRMEWFDPERSPGPEGMATALDPVFLRELYRVLRIADEAWADMARQAAYVGKAGDAHQLLLDIIGLHPGSVEYYQRYAESLDDLYNRLNVGGLGGLLVAALATAGYVESGRALLADLGYNSVRGEPPLPDILGKSFLTAQQQLDGPVVDEGPLSESQPIRSYTSDGRNYIQWLIDAARSSLETLRVQRGFSGEGPPSALLYLWLRHALLLGYWNTSLRLQRSAGLLTDEEVRTSRREPSFIHVAGTGGPSESRWAMLYKVAPAITGSGSLVVADYIARRMGSADAGVHDLQAQAAALELLQNVPTARLERVFAEHIDCCTYRLDAWQTGLLNYQLLGMRFGSDSTPSRAASEGIYVGAYGWLEDVRPESRPLIPVELDEALAPIFNGEGTAVLMHDESNGGYIHAPSLNHAITAAVLRNGYISNATPENPGTFAVDLSSERVRLALSVLEGIRNGQSLGALLGYRLERGLHDRHRLGPELDRFIFGMRKAFPLVADRMASTRSPDDAPIEAIEARNVLDGLELVTHVKQTGASHYPFGKDLPPASAEEAAGIDAEVNRLLDVHDALADLAIAEGVHQAVQGNYDRVAASLDAYGKATFPPEPDVIRTPRRGIGLNHRVAVHLETGLDPNTAPGPFASIPVSPRAYAEPGLNKWLATLLPPPDKMGCKVTYVDPVTGTHQEHGVTVVNLQVQAIDLLYLVAQDEGQAMTELDDRVLRYVIGSFAPRADAAISIQYMQRPEEDAFSFFELAPLLRSLRSLIFHSRALRAGDIALQNEATQAQDAAIETMPARLRLARVRSDLETLHTDLVNLKDELEPLISDLAAGRDRILAQVDTFIDQAGHLFSRAGGFGLGQAGWGGLLDWKRRAFEGVLAKVQELVERWTGKLSQFDSLLAGIPDAASDEEKYRTFGKAELLISIAVTSPLPPTAEAYRSAVLIKRTAFTTRLGQLQECLTTYTGSLSMLLARVRALSPVSSFDLTGLQLDDNEQAILSFTSDLCSRLSSFSTEVGQRLQTAQNQLDAHDATSAATERVQALQAAGNVLLGDDFHVLPEFQLAAGQGSECEQAVAASRSGELFEYLTGDLGVDFPVDDWLYGAARVREKLGSWEQLVMLTEAFGQTAPVLTPAQLPFHEGDRWLALQFPADRKLYEEGDHLLYTAHYATPFDRTQSQCGLLIDEWTEVIPAEDETTGITFHYDRPNAEPPQVMLLVTPPAFRGAWQWQDLVDALNETMEMARKRAVEPAHVDATAYARFLPATLTATSLHEISIGLNLAVNIGLYRFMNPPDHA